MIKRIYCTGNIFHDICIPGNQCADLHKVCYLNHGNGLGICVCKDNYIGFGSRCLVGNLSFGQDCERNEQCSALTNSQCLLRKCNCREGYIPINKSECIPGNHDICIPGIQCLDPYKKCYLDHENHLGVCVCKDNYIGVGNRCVNGNLSFGQDCERNEQCSALTNSQCRFKMCDCREGYIPINKSECIPERVPLGGSCVLSEQCSGSSDSGQCRESRCACKEGYISFNQHCYPGNLTLNETCEIHVQCSTVNNSVCENGQCVCRDGYTVLNSTHCEQEENIVLVQRDYLAQKSSNGLGMIFGAIFGGFLLGVLLTALAVYVYNKRCASDLRKRGEPGIAFVGDAVYGTNSAVEVIKDETSVNQGKDVQRRVVNVPPYAPPVESPTYCNVQEAGKSKMENEYVYNHLNEKEENPENNDHYGIAPGRVTEGDYSHLNTGRKNDRIILSQEDEYACAKESTSDNYFKLEKQ